MIHRGGSMKTLEGWEVVHTVATEVEADLIKGKLESEGISAIVLSQQDHSFPTTMGDLALVRVLVEKENLDRAKEMIAGQTGFPPDTADEGENQNP
ncbi:MAG: hypothetical protein COS95_02440 [Ignavibacteriales bacterium CG07_land_8_20_14_0_80_59_12]|nr:MAG: hypothetical protein COS95_02440 [Ignavibacteriales bacterium CG07_land_8_20_14_0_80_59_12]